MKIMTWNIKGAASLAWNNQYKIESKLVDKIIEQKADIFVLTEFVIAKGLDYLFERLENEGYIWIQQSRTGKNGILIGIKKTLVDSEKLVQNVYDKNAISSNNEDCNILKIEVPLQCGGNLFIIGCRMETGGEQTLKEQYNAEKDCFDNILMPMIQPLGQESMYIVSGDFNNARCLGNLHMKFKEQDYAGKDHCNYNLNIIKDAFDNIGFTMIDVDEKGQAIATYKKRLPLDHIFIKKFKVEKYGISTVDELSDHDILWAEVQFEKLL